MRNFLATSFIVFALVVSAAGAAPAAHAQFYDAFGNSYSTQAEANKADADAAAASAKENAAAGGGLNANGTLTAQQYANVNAANAAKILTDYKSGENDSIFNSIMQKIMSLFAWLVGAAAIILDNTVYYTVVRMGEYVGSLSAVGVTWRILRDVGNIILIFGFLAIGITTILNVNWYGSYKKMIPMLLVAAVSLNFSLFISETIVDAGNLFATEFYKEINGGQIAGAKNFDIAAATNDGIANKIMGRLGLQGIYGSAIKNTNVLEGSNPLFIGFMGVILFLVTAFVMFSLAFILIARFVALLFLIIVAPVGFVGLAVPRLKTLAGQWWGKLFEQTITAPVLLLMLYIALSVITDEQFLTGFVRNSSDSALAWTGFVGNTNLPGFAGVLLSFLVAMGLLLAVVVFAKNLSAFGAGWATKTAGTLSFGATAWAGRNSGGWLANKGAKYLKSTRFARVPLVGTGIVKGLDKVAASSFDIRGTGALKNLPGGGIDAGTAQKGGYKADLKARIESRTKYASELTGKELTEDEKIRLAAKQKDLAENEKRVNEMRMQQARNRDQGIADAALDERIKGEQALNKANKEEIEKIESATAKGAQRKYASNLELGYLGLNEKSFFNKYINFAANTEAAKKIREEAKKSKDDKDLENLRKALKKAGGEDDHAAPAAPVAGAAPAGGAPPAGGGVH